MKIKNYYEKEENKTFEYCSKTGIKVRIKEREIYNSGEAFYIFGDLVQSRSWTKMEYEKDLGYTKGKKTWPAVKRIFFDEENDALLFEDYVVIQKPDEILSENALVTNIYFYVSFTGEILSAAYSPLLAMVFPLDNIRGKESNLNFEELYSKEVQRITQKMQTVLQLRNKEIFENPTNVLVKNLIKKRDEENEDSKC